MASNRKFALVRSLLALTCLLFLGLEVDGMDDSSSSHGLPLSSSSVSSRLRSSSPSEHRAGQPERSEEETIRLMQRGLDAHAKEVEYLEKKAEEHERYMEANWEEFCVQKAAAKMAELDQTDWHDLPDPVEVFPSLFEKVDEDAKGDSQEESFGTGA